MKQILLILAVLGILVGLDSGKQIHFECGESWRYVVCDGDNKDIEILDVKGDVVGIVHRFDMSYIGIHNQITPMNFEPELLIFGRGKDKQGTYYIVVDPENENPTHAH